MLSSDVRSVFEALENGDAKMTSEMIIIMSKEVNKRFDKVNTSTFTNYVVLLVKLFIIIGAILSLIVASDLFLLNFSIFYIWANCFGVLLIIEIVSFLIDAHFTIRSLVHEMMREYFETT